MSETPSLAQGLQSCPRTHVLLLKANLLGTCLHLGTETEPLVGLGGFLLHQGPPSSPWSQLLMLAAAHGPACVILGEEMQESQLFPRVGECVAGWYALPGSPAGEKDPCDAGLHPAGPIAWLRVQVHLPQAPPKLGWGVGGGGRCSTVAPSLAARLCSAPALAALLMTPRHPDSPQPQQTHSGKQGRKRKTPKPERVQGCPHPQPPVPRHKGCLAPS